ncbi:MAG: hypothetical protein ACLTYW_11735 [Collinsella sp.]
MDRGVLGEQGHLYSCARSRPGPRCDSAAHISALRRTASGVVSIGACHAAEELSPESAAGFALIHCGPGRHTC